MPHSNPFLLFAWQRAFLPDLRDYLLRETRNHPENVLIITPNERPWLYFAQCFKTNKAVVLPKMLSFARFVATWRREVEPAPAVMANSLDQVALLWECVARIAATEPMLAERFAKMELANFLPWGMRLAKLLEDIFTQGLEPVDLAAPEGDVDKYADALLAALGKIGAAYKALLIERGFTTSGLDCALACAHAAEIPEALRPAPDWLVLVAGFSTLDGVQKKLFRSLWQAGARICIHADPNLMAGRCYDPACQSLADWQKAWKTTFELVTPAGESQPAYSFFAGYDSHSQLEELVRNMAAKPAGTTAIVLPDPALLLPTLHHIPDKDVNISMGYPVRRTPVRSLLETIFKMYLRKRPQGAFYWRDLLKVLQHPLLSILERPTGQSMRPTLVRLANLVRSQQKFVSIDNLLSGQLCQLEPEEAAFLQTTLQVVVLDWSRANSPASLAVVLANLCNFLSEYGKAALEFFPLNAEAMKRMTDKILPEMRQNLMADVSLDLHALHNLFAMLLSHEWIPFEAYPLVGTQIIGLLETRLLQFDNVFVLDASDDNLPGKKPQDPLLPDNLRALLGLGSSKSRNETVAYNLARLCHCARNVHFYWAEGTPLSELVDGKHCRSRYIEQLIWNYEQRQGRLLKTGEGPLAAASTQASLKRAKASGLERTPLLDKLVREQLQGRLSAAYLNDFLRCPLRFAYKRLLKLAPLAEVSEEDDPLAVGRCVHAVMRNLLTPYQQSGENLAQEDALKTLAANVASELMAEIPKLKDKLPVDAYLHFELASEKLLKQYFEEYLDLFAGGKDAQTSHIIQKLEYPLKADLQLNGKKYHFEGILDRLDKRHEKRDADCNDSYKLVILDYKTGAVRNYNPDFWQDAEFFAKLAAALADETIFAQESATLLETIRKEYIDIQLPLYLLLSAAAPGLAAANAAFVYLCEPREVWLLPDNADLELAREHFRLALAFLLKYLEKTQLFAPCFDACQHCEYAGLCEAARALVLP